MRRARRLCFMVSPSRSGSPGCSGRSNAPTPIPSRCRSGGWDPQELFIDVLIGLPELVDETATPETIAPLFRHMRLDRAGDAPVCRLRLEARWEDDGTVEGDVSQDLYWIDTLEPTPTEAQKHPVSAADRGLIELYYTPASRDAGAQIRATTGALAAGLLRAIEWSSETQRAVAEATRTLGQLLSLRTRSRDQRSVGGAMVGPP